MVAGASLADWVSAGSDVLAAVGTVGAFATGFLLIKRERDLVRASGVAGVQAFWQRTGETTGHADVERNLRAIYAPAHCRRDDAPVLAVSGPDRDARRTRWYTYELRIRNTSPTQINTVELLIPIHDGLGHTPGRWRANTCPIAAAPDAAPLLQDGRPQYVGFSLRQPIDPGADKLAALIAYPSRIAFPEPVDITFIDGNGQQWRREASGRVRRMLSSTRKAAWRRRFWKRRPDRYHWRETVGEREEPPTTAGGAGTPG
ncbi:hypothetical protein BJF78_17425 [Pseudonocardia sp. CNS-139]|nr:hypothetical protein BJF78_17425 [Pseudonocardia sp. CNS-139]